MKEYFYDDFEETEEDEFYNEDDFGDEEFYPTAEEYNRIHKQKYDYF